MILQLEVVPVSLKIRTWPLQKEKQIQTEYKELFVLYQDEVKRAQISVIELIALLQKRSTVNLNVVLKEITIKKLINEGEITGPGLPAFVIFETGPNDWVVRVNVSDRDWARLSLGMLAKVTMDAYEGTVFTGKVTDLAASADPASGLYPVEIRIATQGKRFAPGLFAKVDITPSKSRVYAIIPIEAIVEGNGKSAFVFALQPDGVSVKKLAVQIAFLDGNKVLIASGLEGVSEVVTAGAPYLSEKKKVRKVD